MAAWDITTEVTELRSLGVSDDRIDQCGYIYWESRWESAIKAGNRGVQASVQELLRSARPAPAPRRSVDRRAARVGSYIGATTRATGRCHYCGLTLTHGYCEECQ